MSGMEHPAPSPKLRSYLGNEVRHRILETLTSTGLAEDEAQRRFHHSDAGSTKRGLGGRV